MFELIPEGRLVVQGVPEALWTAAHARLERTRQTYVVGGRLGGRPEAGIESPYLLSGFVLCGRCQGAMHAIKRTSRRAKTRVYYACNGWRVNGTCANAWSVNLPDLDAAVVSALEEEVLTPDLVDDVVARAVALWGEQHAGLGAKFRALTRELHQVERQLGRFADAVGAATAPLPSLLAKLEAGERRRGELQAQLEHLDGLSRSGRPGMMPELRATLRARCTDWQGLLRGNPIEARPILRQLLVGRITLHPRTRPDGRFYELAATTTYGGLLAGVVAGLVPPG